MKSKFKKIGNIAVIMVMALMLSASFPAGAYALNDTSNKAFNYCGYQVVDNDTLYIYLDKSCPDSGNIPVEEQFKIKPTSGSDLAFDLSSYQTGTGMSGVSATNLDSGTRIQLDLDGVTFQNDTEYEVTISNTLIAKNGCNIGSYFKAKDEKFKFRYNENNSTIVVTPRLETSSTDIPWEPNFGFTIDRSVLAATASNIISGMDLQKWSGSQWDSVIKDSTVDSSAVTGAECYTAVGNDARNYFFFPMTGGGKTTISYNLLSADTQYKLIIPSFTDNGDSYAGSNIVFTTTEGDIPGKLVDAPAVDDIGDFLVSVSWSASGDSPAAATYKVYYSDNQYDEFDCCGSTDDDSTELEIDLSEEGLSSGNYYFRVTPLNSYGEEGGYSLAGMAYID